MPTSILRSVRVVLGIFLLLSAMGAAAKPGKKKVGLDGYCPVAYKFGKAVKGTPGFSSEYKGTTFQFPNAQAKQMFDKEPGSYAVPYDGLCATAMAYGKKVASDPEVFEVYKDRVYRFVNQAARDAFDQDRDALIVKADDSWAKLSR